MPIVLMPDGVKVNFDDAKYNSDQIKSMINKKFPEYRGKKEEVPSVGRTILDQGLQGASLGFSDEITDRIGAGIASTVEQDLTYSDALKQARDMSGHELSSELKNRPGTSIASQFAGGLITGGASAGTKAGQAATNMLRTGNAAARIGKGALAGAIGGGVQGFGSGTEGNRLSNAGENAVYGAVFGGAIPAIGEAASSIKDTVKSLKSPGPGVTSDMIRQEAGKAYKYAENTGGQLSNKFTNKFIEHLDSLKPQTAAGKLISGEDEVSKIVDKFQSLRDRPLSLAEIQEVDEHLGDAIDGFTEMGRLKKPGQKLYNIQSELRSMIDDAGEDVVEGGKEGFDALKEGRKLWSKQAKLRDVEKIINRAELSDNPATAIKSGFRTLLSNEKRLRGFNAEERALIKRAADSGIISDTLRTILGSRLNPIIAGASGGGLGATALTQMGSMAARGAATRAQMGKASDLARLISQDSKFVKPSPKAFSLGSVDEVKLLPDYSKRISVDNSGNAFTKESKNKAYQKAIEQVERQKQSQYDDLWKENLLSKISNSIENSNVLSQEIGTPQNNMMQDALVKALMKAKENRNGI